MRALFILPLAFLLPGCVASVVKDVVTAPVKVVSKTADVMTTSQSEADEKRGRALRKQEERLGKLARKRDDAREERDTMEKLNKQIHEELVLRGRFDRAARMREEINSRTQ